MTSRTAQLLGLGAALGAAFLLVVASGAVGIVGDGGRVDRVYVAVPVVLVLGSVAARLRPGGLVLAVAATALTQVVVTSTVLLGGLHEEHGGSAADLVGVTAGFVAVLAVAAWLLSDAGGPGRTSGRRRPRPGAGAA